MLIINNHNSHIFIKFNEYCKFNNIIIINIFAHSFHLLQSLNVKLYSFLKFAYGHQINFFIYIFINYIIKIEIFITYSITHNAVFIKKDIKKIQKYWNFILGFKFCHFKIKCLFLYINIFFISFKFQSSMGIANIKNPKINIFAILFNQELYFYPSKIFIFFILKTVNQLDKNM